MMNAINDHRQPYWYPSFIEPDEGYRRVRIDHTRRASRPLRRAGRAPHHHRAGRTRSRRGRRGQAAVDLFVEALKPLAEHAHKLGVLLLIEPEPELLVETTDQYLEIADRVNAPSIGLNFDVGHAYCVGEDIPKAIAKLASGQHHLAITTSRTSPRPGSTITWSPARGRSTSARSSPRSGRPATTAG